MEPRWQSDMYGSRNPVAMLLGTSGWGLFVATPWMQVDLRIRARGRFVPCEAAEPDAAPADRAQPAAERSAKGLPPADSVVPGLVDLFLFDAPTRRGAEGLLRASPARRRCRRSGRSATCSRIARSRTTRSSLGIVDRFREKQLPLDAVIYLGTGFAPRGWNTKQPSFDFNPDVFTRDPEAVLADMHARHVKVVVHMVPWDRDRLPTLHGTIPPTPGETVDHRTSRPTGSSTSASSRRASTPSGPTRGTGSTCSSAIKRHQLYYQGALSAKPNVRPWSLQRNGYPGIAQWGGWVWSGDTESSWKTLEAQIAVGLNYSLSIGPYWGSDIGGFYANNELDGELYARWFQFAAFCGSFRSHGRTWWTRLPWGWGGTDMGPREHNNTNAPIPPDDRRNILASSMNNPAIEPVAQEVRRAALSAAALHVLAGPRGPRHRPAADARAVAALSLRRAGAPHRRRVSCGAAIC